jgi:hypothetical protein
MFFSMLGQSPLWLVKPQDSFLHVTPRHLLPVHPMSVGKSRMIHYNPVTNALNIPQICKHMFIFIFTFIFFIFIFIIYDINIHMNHLLTWGAPIQNHPLGDQPCSTQSYHRNAPRSPLPLPLPTPEARSERSEAGACQSWVVLVEGTECYNFFIY